MNEALDYIDRYFQKGLTEAEAKDFEGRCQTDEDFADTVAFYIMSRQAAKEKLVEEKASVWPANERPPETNVVPMAPVRRQPFKLWISYAAAACVLLLIGLFFLFPKSTPQSLAHVYVQKNLSQIGHTMDGATDSMQKGISAYNDGKYAEALALFTALYKANPDNNDALEYAGRSCLKQKNYEEALALFTELANKKLVSNRGPFLKAVTLLERNAAGDKEAAKKLLERVRNEELEGSNQAADWLNKW